MIEGKSRGENEIAQLQIQKAKDAGSPIKNVEDDRKRKTGWLSGYACPERPSTPGAWRLTLRVTGEAPVRPERSEVEGLIRPTLT